MSALYFLVVFACGYATCYFQLLKKLLPANPVTEAIEAEQKAHGQELIRKMMGRTAKK